MLKNAWKTHGEMEATRLRQGSGVAGPLRQGFGVAEQGRHPGITG